MCFPKGLIDWDTFGCNFPLLGAKSHLPTSLARDEETIICGALNEKIQITVCLEHHELLYICKFDQFSLLPDQRPRKNHLRSKWHIQWEGWTLCLKHHKLSHVYFWQSLTEWQTCHFLLQVNYSQFVKWSSGFQGRLQNDSILIQETPHVQLYMLNVDHLHFNLGFRWRSKMCWSSHWDEPISGQPLSFIPLNHLSSIIFTFTGSSRLRTSFKGEILPRQSELTWLSLQL